ncbi:MAG: enoyl-CoA hydratase/isomerase family protein [Alphaproteobacteria bacterium]|nr:enoyl-CoA hydratase/isomerase family protein [Alphaproteobacteria bacterium]MDE2341423.1 enoyl-CoA hydratase/isomerase family protein [Alphaproteobacteria bacterium]
MADRGTAATILERLLRAQRGMNFEQALEMESLAYSTLLGGAAFRRWLVARGDVSSAPIAAPPLQVARDGNTLTLMLNDPANRNAISAPMRDGLFDILTNALDDPTQPHIIIKGAGKCFSVGGHLPEFGTASDLAQAYLIRMERSIARLIDALRDRCTVHFHGAVIGSGLEVFAAAARCTAMPDTWFQLPEVKMGLIPGAGGTVTIPRRIGHERALELMLSGKRIGAGQALDWSLIDEIVG